MDATSIQNVTKLMYSFAEYIGSYGREGGYGDGYEDDTLEVYLIGNRMLYGHGDIICGEFFYGEFFHISKEVMNMLKDEAGRTIFELEEAYYLIEEKGTKLEDVFLSVGFKL